MSIQGIYRLSACVPSLRLGDPSSNVTGIVESYRAACAAGSSVAVFPELCLTGYSCGDLFCQRALLEASWDGLRVLRDATKGQGTVLVVGMPLLVRSRLFDVAAVLQDGHVCGFAGKTYLAEYGISQEKRQFRSVLEHDGAPVEFDGEQVPFGAGLVFQCGGEFSFGIEIGEDLRVPVAPSCLMALNGAQAILNLSAEGEFAGSAEKRRSLVASQSARLSCAYILANAGTGESTSDFVFGGHSLAAVNGRILAETPRFARSAGMIHADFLPRWLEQRRREATSFNEVPVTACRRITLAPLPQCPSPEGLHLPQLPFVPEEPAKRAERCREILEIQATGLARRVEHTHSKRLVIGLSGGLDSTLALLVSARCCDILGVPRSFILALTMPGMGTTGRTKNNAIAIAEECGAELREVDIRPAVLQHFKDIGHDPENLNVTYENSQARERTQILMDLANEVNGLVVGTGDLSEIALGWCTFNGDHISMYGVNCDVPKTLIRFLVEHIAEESGPRLAALLRDVNATPVSPELLPGEQHTESIIGNYDLHDFFLYYFLKYAATPQELECLAFHTFHGVHSAEKIHNTLKVFVRRFFPQQFKRNAAPDGPKVGSVALGARGDWRMPSDVFSAPWQF